MSKFTTRFLPHILLGIAFATGLPMPAVASDDTPPATEAPADIPPMAMPESTPEERATKAAKLFWEAIRVFNSGSQQELAAARAWLKQSAELGSSHARFEMARYSVTGMNGFPVDKDAGARLFLKAAEQGNGFAMIATGQCYLEGTGVKADDTEAERWLNAALADGADFS